ncbi:MAG: hypothetical protein GY714_05465 [Desulfobacterales bacterium]|nr:hypothetical protein [Desulfobacterales bacterium]
MKTSLEHLPEQKQQELQRAVEIIREEMAYTIFGSYARGDWVEDLDPETETSRQTNKIEQNNKITHKLAKASIEPQLA